MRCADPACHEELGTECISCGDTFCDSCIMYCDGCGEPYCESCLGGSAICEDCQAEEDEEDEE